MVKGRAVKKPNVPQVQEDAFGQEDLVKELKEFSIESFFPKLFVPEDKKPESSELEAQREVEEDPSEVAARKKFIEKELLQHRIDPNREKLVQRPEKGVVWGLGGELLLQKKSKN